MRPQLTAKDRYWGATRLWTPIAGDWDGDGKDEVGAVDMRTMTFHFRSTRPAAVPPFPHGVANGDFVPIVGDWDGDGKDGIGVVDLRTMTFYLRDSLSQGEPKYTFKHGGAGDVPIVGDWDGDGKDGIGAVEPSTMTFRLRNSLSQGEPKYTFKHGGAGDVPIVGDWDGDGKDGIGAVEPSTMTFRLRNSLSKGDPDYIFRHGNATGNCVPIVGNWDGDRSDRKDGIGIVYTDSMTYHLRKSLSIGLVDYQPFRCGGPDADDLEWGRADEAHKARARLTASKGPAAETVIGDLVKAKLTGRYNVEFPFADASRESKRVNFAIRDLVVNPFQLGRGQTAPVRFSGKVEPFVFLYTTDINGPPAVLGDTRRDDVVIYPVDAKVRVIGGSVSGRIALGPEGPGIEGTMEIDGDVTVDVPRRFRFKDAPARAIPVPPGDNDPSDGPLGWEYKTWNRPLDGVRQPRREDLKGCPELGRFNRSALGDVNFYLFVRPKPHPFRITANFRCGKDGAALDSVTFYLTKPLSKCPEDFKDAMARHLDWDYAIDGSGLGAGIIQDLIAEPAIVKGIEKYLSGPVRLSVGPQAP